MCLRHPGPGPAPPGAPPVWEALQPGGREGSGQARGRSWGPAGATPTGRSGRQALPSPLFPRVVSATERGRARVWPPRARAAWKATQQASGGRAGGQPPPSGSGRGQAGRPEGFRPFQKAPPLLGLPRHPAGVFLLQPPATPTPFHVFRHLLGRASLGVGPAGGPCGEPCPGCGAHRPPQVFAGPPLPGDRTPALSGDPTPSWGQQALRGWLGCVGCSLFSPALSL